jgi:hypothetical protein
MRRSSTVTIMTIVIAFAATLSLVACDEETTSDPDPTATAALATDLPVVTVTAPTDTPGASGIREFDFSTQADVAAYITDNGGEVDTTVILYADLTGDGAEEAIVPISSGGTLGNLAIFVFSYDSIYGATQLLLAEPDGAGGISADLQEGQLFTDEAVFGPNDPQCCPSTVHRTYYRWDGSALIVDREEDIPADPGVR